jgi:hypothetical protein
MAVCLPVASLSTAPAFATWYMSETDGYYKPQEYHNEKFGDFPPADIDQKLFGHLTTEKEESIPKTDSTSLSSSSNQLVSPPGNPQVLNPAQNYTQPYTQQPAYGSYNRGRNFTSPGMERHIRNRNAHISNSPWNNRSSSFSGPWNSRGSSFSGPWNNNGSSFSGPWNNRGSGFSGPWNNNSRGTNFSGPWNNNGSSFSMPWGNNNGSSFSPFGKDSGWSW